MPPVVRIFHNPSCSKSRAALDLLQGRGFAVDVVNYLTSPPTALELAALLTKLALPPTALVRFQDSLAASLGIAATDHRHDDEWLDLLAAHPSLLERPIVEANGRAVIGRPIDNVEALIASAVR